MARDFIADLKKNRIIPVAQFESAKHALKIAELLLKHSIGILEVTLRTESAIECIAKVKKEFPGMMIGAGSVLSSEPLNRAIDAGASFCVSPGTDFKLIDLAASREVPFIPGVSTPTELNAALKKCKVIKIFPVSALGGIEYLKAITAPFKIMDYYMVPTGGISKDNYLDYLIQDRVISVGMSYIVDSALIKKEDFAGLEDRMKIVTAGLA